MKLASIYEIRETYGGSIDTLRQYKLIGLISSVERRGRKDFYDKEKTIDRLIAIDFFKWQKKQLPEIKEMIDRIDNPEVYELIGYITYLGKGVEKIVGLKDGKQ